MFAETNAPNTGVFKNIAEAATAADYKDVSFSLDGRKAVFTNRLIAASNDVVSPADSLVTNQFAKLAGTYYSNGADLSYNGLMATQKNNATSRIGPADRIWIGSRLGSAIFLNGHLRRITYWPVRLANSTLQAISQ